MATAESYITVFFFKDLSVPLGGLPIVITRTYSSIERFAKGEFSYGWEMGIRDIDLKEDGNRKVLGSGPDNSQFIRQAPFSFPKGKGRWKQSRYGRKQPKEGDVSERERSKSREAEGIGLAGSFYGRIKWERSEPSSF